MHSLGSSSIASVEADTLCYGSDSLADNMKLVIIQGESDEEPTAGVAMPVPRKKGVMAFEACCFRIKFSHQDST